MHGTDRRSLPDGMKAAHATSYRPDIDGLRAIAVLSVVAFHAFPTVIRSGFVGVDIFFVISGYLISSIIFQNLAAKRFSFIDFYARRIRRIFPALILVLTVSLVVGAILLMPDDFRRVGKHSAAGAAFVANLALWQEANYFDVASDTKILLHLWSLGVEEQFYVIWPALIWGAWRARLRRLPLLFTILFASLAFSILATPLNQVAAFYSPTARFWELATGAVLAQIDFNRPRIVAWIEGIVGRTIRTLAFEPDVDEDKCCRDFLSLLGLGLIVPSFFVITRPHEFPGWWALMPVVGAYLTIAGGPGAWLNRFLLSNPVLVWFGLISYPLYLWHWPLLAFARIYYGSSAPPTIVVAGLMVGAIVLAWLTYHFVERPVRFGFQRRWTVRVLSGAMATIAALGCVDMLMDGLPGRLGEKAAYAWYFWGGSPLIQNEYLHYISQDQCNFYIWGSVVPTLAPKKSIDPSCYTKTSKTAVMLIGDSNTSDLYYGLREVLPKEVSLLLIWSSGCQVSPIVQHIIETHHCTKANYFALERIKADPPDVLLLSSNNSYDINYIRQFATLVKGYGVKHVLVLGQRPHWKPFLYKVVLDSYWPTIPRYIPGHLDEELMSLTKTFQSHLRPNEPFEFVDEMQPFCNATGCLTYLGDNPKDGLITADTVHLRPFASIWLARQQLAPLIMERLGG